MSARWEALPSSDQEQMHLALTTTTVRTTTTVDPMMALRQRVGGFIREQVAGGGRSVCYYSHLDTAEPLPFLCEMGCCSTGCCSPIERAREYNVYSWALALLIIVLVVILLSILVSLVVYLLNKSKSREMRRVMFSNATHTESSNVSQVSDRGSPYYYPDGIYPYASSKFSLPY